MIELEKLSTEENNPNSKDIELQDSLEVVRRINEEDKKVAFCVEKELESISRLIDAILLKYKKETRIIYIGAGTSGRLGILDASECPPTYGVSFEKVQGIIAGGNEAIFKAKENAEDSPELGKQDLININLTKNDVVIGLAASGRTPYVLGAIEYANMIVYEKSKEDEKYKYMGATLEILLIINDDIYIGHAGDSRIYRLRKDVLKKLTKDHSYIENLIEDGKITREEAVKHPDKNMVTKGIGNSKLVEPDVIHKKFKNGDTILMCTDGLTNMVSEERIKEILKEEGDVSKKLTDEANKNGGMDNITVVVIKK